MTMYSLTFLGPHHFEVQNLLFPGDGVEHAAYILFGNADIPADPWTGEPHQKYVSHEVIPIPTDEIVSHGVGHITWKMDSFVRALKSAREKDMTLGVIHCHPEGYLGFSEQDNRNETDWSQLAHNRNGTGTRIISLVATSDGGIVGRVWESPVQKKNIDLIRVFGERFRMHYGDRGVDKVAEAFDRQALAFGAALNQDLSMLRIGIIGLGGTGSALNMLIGRLGPGFLALFDADTIEESNRNRVHGSKPEDVTLGLHKVDIAERVIREMSLGTQVKKYPYWVDDRRCHVALKSCDIIFGCTDDNDGRIVINQVPFHYGIPLIDVGLAIELTKTKPTRMLACDGRVTVVSPGEVCLICREIINVNIARDESMKRQLPEQYQKLKEEAYVTGEGNPAPAVAFFTTEVATMALQELVHRLQGFRGDEGSVSHVVRKFHLRTDRRPKGVSKDWCSVCAQTHSWGRADDTRFLGLI